MWINGVDLRSADQIHAVYEKMSVEDRRDYDDARALVDEADRIIGEQRIIRRKNVDKARRILYKYVADARRES